MSNADQLVYFKMEEQIRKGTLNANDLILTYTPQPAINVNAQGEIIFDEASLGLLDEHIRKVVREEWKRIQQEIVMQYNGGRI